MRSSILTFVLLGEQSLKQVACKRIKRNKLSKSCLASVQREVNILKTVSHVRICRASHKAIESMCSPFTSVLQPNINQVKDVVVSELDV